MPTILLAGYIAVNPLSNEEHAQMASILKTEFNEVCYTACHMLLTHSTILQNFQHENNKKCLDQYCEVLVENKLDNQEKYFGRTQHMIPVIFEADDCKTGDLVNVKITSFNQKNLFGIFKNNNKVKAA